MAWTELWKNRARRGVWRLLIVLHHLDFAWLLPCMARLPLGWAFWLGHLRGLFNARTGRDWRSMALGMRHIRRQSVAGYRLLPVTVDEAQLRAWSDERFVVEARDELEARLVAAGRVHELACRSVNANGGSFVEVAAGRSRGLLLLTPHFESFFVGVAFAARAGAKVNLMSSAVTHDPRVDTAVQAHFSAKYRGLEPWLNGGQVLDMEQGIRPFYRMLERGETLVVLGDAPVLPNGVSATVDFLGAQRLIAGGALRLAQKADCDIGGYVCRMERPGHYVMEWCEPGPANDPATIQRVYALFTQAILSTPGRWWASDLLPAIPPCPKPAPDYAVLVLSDSPLHDTQELAQGLRTLRRQWPGTTEFPVHQTLETSAESAAWHLSPTDQAPPLGAVLDAKGLRHLLVVLNPAVLATTELPQLLAECLESDDNALCALADDARFAHGEWAPNYSTQVDFERYVARRAVLPLAEPAPQNLRGDACVYMLRLDRLRRDREHWHALWENASWRSLPSQLGERSWRAPRAFVHSYADYQQGDRAEMLELLPANVRRLLDVGGGEGGFARAFVRDRGGEALLVEPGTEAAQRAMASGLRVFNIGMEQLDAQQVGALDAISFLDVLEHLTDPLSALVTARRLLGPGGALLVSVPNAGFWPVVRDLLAGRLDYLPVGILCQTHLRFFTANSLEQLLHDASFDIVTLRRRGPPPSPELEQFLSAAKAAGLACDRENLATESLHVLARVR